MNALFKMIVPALADKNIPPTFVNFLTRATGFILDFVKNKNLYSGANLQNIKSYSLDFTKLSNIADEYATQKNLRTEADFNIKVPRDEYEKAKASIDFIMDKYDTLGFVEKTQMALSFSEIMSEANTFYNQNKSMLNQSSINNVFDLYYFSGLFLCWLTQTYPDILSKIGQPSNQTQPTPTPTPTSQNTSQQNQGSGNSAIEPELVGPPVSVVPVIDLVSPTDHGGRIKLKNDKIFNIIGVGFYTYADLPNFINQVIGDLLIDKTELIKAIMAFGVAFKYGVDLNKVYTSPAMPDLIGIDPVFPYNKENAIVIKDPDSILKFNDDSLILGANKLNNVFNFLMKGYMSDSIIKNIEGFNLGKDITNKINTFASRTLIDNYFRSPDYGTSLVIDKIKTINPDFIKKIQLMIKFVYILTGYALSCVRDIDKFLIMSSNMFLSYGNFNTILDTLKPEFFKIAQANSTNGFIKIPNNITPKEFYLDMQISFKLFLGDSALSDILSELDYKTDKNDPFLSGTGKVVSQAQYIPSDMFRYNRHIIDRLQYKCLNKIIANKDILYSPLPQTATLEDILVSIPGLSIDGDSITECSHVFDIIVDAFNNIFAWDETGKPQDAGNLYDKKGKMITSEYACNLSYLQKNFEQVNKDFIKMFPKNTNLIEILDQVFERANYRLTWVAYNDRFGIDGIIRDNNLFINLKINVYDVLYLISIFIIQEYALNNCVKIKEGETLDRKQIRTTLTSKTDDTGLFTEDNILKAIGIVAVALTTKIIINKTKRKKKYY